MLAVAPVAAGGAAGEPPGASESTSTASGVQRAEADFLFGKPTVSAGVRAHWSRPRAESDLFEFVTDELTLSKSDFRAPGVALEAGFPLASRLDVLAGVEFDRASAASEDRRFVEDNGLPILQETALQQLNLSGSLALALTPRGRSIGQYAWITARAIPYVGAGGGLLWYRFEQAGDFVDSLDPGRPIFTAQLVSDGWTVSTHVFGGIDIKLSRRLLLTMEVRYRWADATMGQDFVGFDPVDLTGVRVSAGVRVMF